MSYGQNKIFKLSKHLTVILTMLSLWGFGLLWDPEPGLDRVEPIGPYLDYKLPTEAPTGNIGLEEIYSSIQWESPIVALPFPHSDDLLVIEMDGRFFTIEDNGLATERKLVMDIQDLSWYYDWAGPGTKHGGIQNAVFHPEFGMGTGKDFLYIYYILDIEADDVSQGYYERLSRFTWVNEAFDRHSELIMINQYDQARGHDGSGMDFGNDGFLYVAVGDEGTQNANATPHTQKIDDRFRSGVWRIDVDQQGGNISHPIRRQPNSSNVPAGGTRSFTQGYYIPSDNPWVNPDSSTLEEFYAIGLRQPFRMTVDRKTGFFWIGDVGSGQKEEVDLMDQPGLNFQWNYMEGRSPGYRSKPQPLIGIDRDPIYEVPREEGNAIIGGYVYRGNEIPALNGKYIFADNVKGTIWALSHVGGNFVGEVETLLTVPEIGSIFSGISSFGYTHDNELLVLKLGQGVLGDGRIYRIANRDTIDLKTLPLTLSETGIFTDLSDLTPTPGLIPYDVNTPLWSAGTRKKRWVAIPSDGIIDADHEKINFSEKGPWDFPKGSVFVKQFDHPNGKKLETRIWIHGADDRWFGATYRWREDGMDADLLEEGGEEWIDIGGDSFSYLFPSSNQCYACHNTSSGWVLGYNTRQLNRDIYYPTTQRTSNQLQTLGSLDLIPSLDIDGLEKAVAIDDNNQSLEIRVRSYLDVNCAHCHQPGLNRAFFDTRLSTPTDQSNLVNGKLIDDLGISGGKVIVPQRVDHSILFQRINTVDACCAMPPLAKGRIDTEAVQLVRNWINSIDPTCNIDSTQYLGNNGGNTNFIDGHFPTLTLNLNDGYKNTSDHPQQICLLNFRFEAQRQANPVTPFVLKINEEKEAVIIAIGQTRSVPEYVMGQNTFPFSDHDQHVIILNPGERMVPGFIDASVDGSGGETQSIIPAVAGDGEDSVWQIQLRHFESPERLFLGGSIDLMNSNANWLSRSYQFGIEIDTSRVPEAPIIREIELYSDCNYSGQVLFLEEGAYPNISFSGFPNEVLSSLKISEGLSVILYEDFNFGGASISLFADAPCLTNQNFNDVVSSIKVRAYEAQQFLAGSGEGLRATYYNDMNFTNEVLTRIDTTIDFNWGHGSPDPSIGEDTYSVRWEGIVEAPITGDYTFITRTDDGERLWVNGQLIIDDWNPHAVKVNSGRIQLMAGDRVSLKMEYFEQGGSASAKLGWSINNLTEEIIPKQYLYLSTITSTSDVEGDNRISLFPSPANDRITINTMSLNDNDLVIYDFYNLKGQNVMTKKGSANLEVDVSNLLHGLYIIQIRSDDFNRSVKFIKN